MEKKELRLLMKRRNRSLAPDVRGAASARMLANVERLPCFARARTVALFASLADEPDTAEALKRWSASRQLLLPRVEGDTMRFYRYDPLAMRTGAFGIAEPAPDAQPCEPAEIDLIIVPGTAFTAAGGRMGRGRGFYDRYLAQPGMRAVKIGLCYAHQVVAQLPAEPHDVPVDRIITEKEMDTNEFVAAFREAFGEGAELPLLFRCTDEPLRPVAKTEGCFFKALGEARGGLPVSLCGSNIGCGGGKFYAGFVPMPEHVPQFVSLKEHYKQTPEQVRAFIDALDVRPAPKPWLEFVRADIAGTFEGAEGVLFFATPDVLSGLVSWACFDSGAADAVAAPFGSGCSSVVTQAVGENRSGGRRCFLGLFDPSVRPWVEPDVLGFVVPMVRFREMCGTMHASCLFGTHAWGKVRNRINGGECGPSKVG